MFAHIRLLADMMMTQWGASRRTFSNLQVVDSSQTNDGDEDEVNICRIIYPEVDGLPTTIDCG
jgi:hypothetical protein